LHAHLLERKLAPAPLDTVPRSTSFANGASGLLGTVRATPQYWRVQSSARAARQSPRRKRTRAARRGAAAAQPPTRRLAARELEMFADAIEARAGLPDFLRADAGDRGRVRSYIRSLESDAR